MLLAVGNVKHNFTDILHKLVYMHQQCFRVAWERGYVRTYIQSCNTYGGLEGSLRASKLFRSQIVPLPNYAAPKLRRFQIVLNCDVVVQFQNLFSSGYLTVNVQNPTAKLMRY